ncbi:hypothetical protein HDV01_005810 [Terramyces sp. JEL0728]|nr:hypothetical protein HDV01_005810 [Terramyces sp. JEL0728]
MAEIWKGMAFEEKKPYVIMAKQERLKYKKDMEEYKRYLEKIRRQNARPVTFIEKLPLLAPRLQKSVIPEPNTNTNPAIQNTSHPDLHVKYVFETDKNQYLIKPHQQDRYSMSAVINKWKFVHRSSSDFEDDSIEEREPNPSYPSSKYSGYNSPKLSGHNSPYIVPHSGSNSPRQPYISPRINTAALPHVQSTTHSGSNSPKQDYYSPKQDYYSPKQDYYSPKIMGSMPHVSSNVSNEDFFSPLSPMASLSLSKNSIDSSVTTTRQNSIAEYGFSSVHNVHNIGGKTGGVSPATSNIGMDQFQLRRTSSPNATSTSSQNLMTLKPQRRLKKSFTSEYPIYEDVRTDVPPAENIPVANSNEGMSKPVGIRIPSQETVREEASPVRNSFYDHIPEVDFTPINNSFQEGDE